MFFLSSISLTTDTVQLAKIADSAVRKVKQNARSLSPVSVCLCILIAIQCVIMFSIWQAEKMLFDRLVNTFSSSVSKFQDTQQVRMSTSLLPQLHFPFHR